MQKPNRTLLCNSGLFQGFCFLKSAKNELKMRCQNVKLFFREPLVEHCRARSGALVLESMNHLSWCRILSYGIQFLSAFQ